MFGLFKKKELKCDLCDRLLEKDKYQEGEAVFAGQDSGSEKLYKMCSSCFNKKLRGHLLFSNGKAVVVKPFGPYKGFAFYTSEVQGVSFLLVSSVGCILLFPRKS